MLLCLWAHLVVPTLQHIIDIVVSCIVYSQISWAEKPFPIGEIPGFNNLDEPIGLQAFPDIGIHGLPKGWAADSQHHQGNGSLIYSLLQGSDDLRILGIPCLCPFIHHHSRADIQLVTALLLVSCKVEPSLGGFCCLLAFHYIGCSECGIPISRARRCKASRSYMLVQFVQDFGISRVQQGPLAVLRITVVNATGIMALAS